MQQVTELVGSEGGDGGVGLATDDGASPGAEREGANASASGGAVAPSEDPLGEMSLAMYRARMKAGDSDGEAMYVGFQ